MLSSDGAVRFEYFSYVNDGVVLESVCFYKIEFKNKLEIMLMVMFEINGFCFCVRSKRVIWNFSLNLN